MNVKILASALFSALLLGCGQSPAPDAPTASTPSDGAPAAAGKIAWNTNFETALAKAKQENKPVLVDFYADWCGPCKMMDKQTFPDAGVVSEMANWIPVKVDVDKNKELSERYNISAIPTTVLISPDGKTISSTAGFMGPKDFLAVLQKGR